MEKVGLKPVAVDLPGHGVRAGRHDPDHFTLDRTLGVIHAAARGLRNVVGYSMGGRLALHYVLRYGASVRRLVLESASPGIETEEGRRERRRADEELARSIARVGVEAFVDRWERLPLFASQQTLPESVRSRHRAERLSNHPLSLAASLRGVGTGSLPSLWDRLGEVEVPTLLLAGALDRKFVEIARRMEERLPGATLVVVEGAGHAVHLERPEPWTSAVGGFLT